jgi:acyl dehydratase
MSTLSEGQALEPFVVESVDPGPMKTMAVLLRDPNPIHWDVAVLGRLGLGDRPINQGPINVGYLMELAGRAAGGAANVRRFDCRFLGNVFAGDRVTCSGTVTAVDADAGTAELELSAEVDGRAVLSATATITTMNTNQGAPTT